MRILIDDTFATKTYTVPIASDWAPIPHGIDVSMVEHLTAENVAPADAALVPSSELRALHASHDVLPSIAVIADSVGAIAMRTPVRPDEIDATPVRLLATGGVAELLARATLQPFYGIRAMAWIRDDDAPEAARAEVVIVDGAEALREPEGGFSEDLCRTWFILTAQPVVSHVLVMPRELSAERRREVTSLLSAVREAGLERRRDWRPHLADNEGVGRERASVFWAAQRLTLEAADRRALLELLAHGSRGTSTSPPPSLRFGEEPGKD